jgi:hypothetical protein
MGILTLTERKRKLKGSKKNVNYFQFYRGLSQKFRTQTVVASTAQKKIIRMQLIYIYLLE